jgi:alpha-tubulin suppressor-like RCC1 family protein
MKFRLPGIPASLASLFVWAVSNTWAQTPSFLVNPSHTKISTGAAVGMGAVLSGGSAVSYTWRKATVVVGSGSAVATNDWKSVAAGASHTLALKNDGSLWGWGSNQNSQLGSAASGLGADFRSAPIRIGTASDWVFVFAGGDRSGAITRDGNVWFWGGTASQSGMRRLSGDQFWESAVLGEMGTAYLLSLGGIYVFNPDMPDSTPVALGSAQDWASVSSGQGQLVAIKRDGTLWARSYMSVSSNSSDGGFYQMQAGRWKTACVGSGFAVALRTDGTLWAWQPVGGGSSNGWSLFNNPWQSQYTPKQLGTRSDWKSLSHDVLPIAVDADGRTWYVAEGWSMQAAEIPVASASAVGRGMSTTKVHPEGLALGVDGTLWAWGSNDWGQLGNSEHASSGPGTYAYDAVQVGVNKAWGLTAPVLGVPLGVVLPTFQPSDLGVYELFVNNVSAGSLALAEWTSGPQTNRLTAGSSLRLTAAGSLGAGTAPTYQWYRNGIALSGATSATYDLSNAQTAASGVYWVELRRAGAAARSKPAAVVVDEGGISNAHDLLANKSHLLASGTLDAMLRSSPSHPTANVLKALTDLYLFSKDGTTNQMLVELGFEGSLDPLNLTLNHRGFPTSGALTAKTRAWMRNVLYPRLSAADGLLGNVPRSDFLGALLASDFGSAGTQVLPFDYGDVQVARAGLNLVMSLLKWIETQNTDVDLSLLKGTRDQGALSLESLLAMYPDLLKASGTASEAQTEFVDRFGKAVAYYLNFSAFANPTPGATGLKRLDPETPFFTLTTAGDRETERRLAEDCIQLQASIAASSAAAGLKPFSLPASGFAGTRIVQASPWVFFRHAPGWRSELPGFKANAYIPASLRPETATAFFPTVQMRDIGRFEADLAAAEPELSRWLKTGRETIPPILQLLTISSGTVSVALQNGASLAHNGSLTVSGTASDATGVGRVVVTHTSGADVSSAVALLVERVPPTPGPGARVFDWTAQLPRLAGTGTIAASASDFAGNSAIASATVTLSAAAAPKLPSVPEQAKQVPYVGGSVSLAAVVPAGGSVNFSWTRNGAPLAGGTSAFAVDDWAAVSVGGDHTAAVKRDGTLWTWGSNASGQLGMVATSRQSPQRVGTATHWASVACGAHYTVALTRSGSLWASGNSPFGTYQQLSAVAGAAGQTWARIACSDSHALLLTRAGRLFSWSDSTGTAVGAASDWVDIAAGRGLGAELNFAIKRDGTLWAWGENGSGFLGLGWASPGTLPSPVQIGTDSDWLTVSTCASQTWSNVLSAALKKDGTLWAWGFAPSFFAGQSWNMAGSGGQMTPRRIGPPEARWSAVALTEWEIAGVQPDGRLFQIGDNWVSAKVPSAKFVSLHAANISFGALGADGVLWMWGANSSGQLGNHRPKTIANPWEYGYFNYTSEPFQTGVDPDWNLPSPVRGIPIPFTVASVTGQDFGLYDLTVTAGTSTTTSAASLYNWQLPGYGSYGNYSYSWVGGDVLKLQGGVSVGNSVVAYQWYRNGVAVTGATSPELSVAPNVENSGLYRVQAVSGKTTITGPAVAVVVDSANVWPAREALHARNYQTASLRLNAALTENPNDAPALFLRAVLDLYNLWSDPSLATHLAALGFSGSPDPQNLTLQWSADGFPKGALSVPVRTWLLEILYPKIVAIEASLAKITNPGFVNAFGPYDLGLQGEDSIVDYGDVQLLRALLNAGLAALKWIETQNSDVDLAALQLDRQNGRLSIESLLSKYPQLLSASATAPAAQTEFVSRFKQAVERYKAFSDFANPPVAAQTPRRQDPQIGTARLETPQDRASEADFRDAINKTLESINATDALAGRRTVQTSGGATLSASPHAFFQHAPGWRNDLPKFTRNAYQRNTLNRSLIQSFYPAFSLADLSDAEGSLARAEPELNRLLGTREDATPPTVSVSPADKLGSYDGWVTLEGTVQDGAGVRRVLVTVAKETFEAELEEVRPDSTGARIYKWRAFIPLLGMGATTLGFSVSAEDVFGAVVDSPVVRVLPLERMVPLTVGSRGEGDLTYTVTPAADENGYVRLGAKLVLTARPKPGSLLRRIDTAIDGETLPQPAYRSSTLTLTIRGETTVLAVFEPNPYLRIGGRNRMAGGMLSAWSDGAFPMSALQVVLTPAGSFSGRLRVGLSSYALAGRFDADGFYSVRLPQHLVYLSWNGEPARFVRPTSSPLSVELKMWVETPSGEDAPVLQAEFGGWVGRGTLSALAERDYTGQPVFTGYLAGANTAGANYQNAVQSVGTSEAARQLWNRTPGWWSVSARKSGTAILTGWVPGRGRFASSGHLSNQETFSYAPGAPSTSPGEYADIQVLSSVNADTVLRLMTTLYTPAAGNSYMAMNAGPSATGTARTEMWYPGNRGPIFESSAASAVGTNAYVAFASVGTLSGVGFTPASTGQTLAPFVANTPGANTPRNLTAKIGFGMGANSYMSTFQKVFDLQVSGRNALGVVPGSANDPGWLMPQLSLNPATGVLSGSAMRWGKRVGLQGVLLQRTVTGGNTPSGLQNAYGVGLTSDGDPFVLTEQTP